MSKPRAPTQPATLATDVSGLAKIGAVAAKVVYRGAGGYGKPSAQKLTLVAEKTVRPFGTLAGQGVAVAPPALETLASTYSIRKTTNYKDYTAGTTIDTCDKAYLMITSVVSVVAPSAAAKNFIITVTASKWGKTLAEQVPVLPGAVTAATAAPAGASQLAASAVAAALTALYLF